MDITDSLAPTSDQLDAIELVTGPRVFTIERVSAGSVEQPVNVHLVEFDRPWRPAKNMRRVLAACWGTDASQWAGRRVKLYFEPEVTFGKDKPGGTRIAALSHIDGQKRVPVLVTRGKSAMFTVEPLSNEPTTEERIASLRTEFRTADGDRKAAILEEVRELQGQSEPAPAVEPALDDLPAHPFAGTGDRCEDCGETLDHEAHS